MPAGDDDSSMTYEIAWLGAKLPIGLPNEKWAARVSDLTGLEVFSVESETSAAEISVKPGNVVRSYKHTVPFASRNDLLIWLVLTFSDVLAQKNGMLLLHAASIVTNRGLILVFGPPFSGKSTLTMMLLDRAVSVLGDDVVYLSTDDGLVRPVPRPVKRRIPGPIDYAVWPDPLKLGSELVGHLDGRPCALVPRKTKGIVSDAAGLPAKEIVFIQRHDGPGIRCSRPPRFEALAAILNWARDWSNPPLTAASRAAEQLLQLDCRTVSIGDNEQAAALDAILWRSAE